MSGSRKTGNLHNSPDAIAPRLRPNQRVSLEDAAQEYAANGTDTSNLPRTGVPDFLDGAPDPTLTPQRPDAQHTDPEPTPRRPDTPQRDDKNTPTPQRPSDPEPAHAELADDTRVKVGTTTVSLAELRNGYMRQLDYTQKTQAVARERTELAEARKSAIPTVQTMLDKVFTVPAAPTMELYNSNMPEYMRQVQARDGIVAARGEIERTLNEMVEQHGKDQAAAKQNKVAAATQELFGMYPQWVGQDGKPTDICRREMDEVIAHLAKAGYSSQEIEGIDDARTIPIVRKAIAYDTLKAAGADAKRVTHGPSPTASAGGGNGGVQPSGQRTGQQPSRFDQTGHLADAVNEYAVDMQQQQREAANGGSTPLAARGRRRLN